MLLLFFHAICATHSLSSYIYLAGNSLPQTRSPLSSVCLCCCCLVRYNIMASSNAFDQVASTSDTSIIPRRKMSYDVFINHRGPDVKRTLAASLYKTLTTMGLRVFLDKEELDLGDFLPAEIEEAMRGASLHIAIFSQNYAESPWCLAELAFMLNTGTQIVPVFCHIEPDVVRYAKGVYAEAFSRHEEKGRYTPEKLQEWKNALNDVSYNVGGIIHNEDDEGLLLKNIVNRVLKEVKNVPFEVAKHPIGLDEILADFERTTLQSANSHANVQVVGISGMGGSGKTTFAKYLYNEKYKSMDRSSFLFDVRDAASKSVLYIKQKKLLEDLGLPGVSVENIEEGKGVLASRLKSVRVLIVIDDVDNVDQLDALVPNKDNLGPNSLIVVTTREHEVLRCWGISSIYKMKLINPSHAKQLFCWHAFLQPSPPQEFKDLVESFLQVCKGLPLSLKIFGAQLYGVSNKEHWNSLLHKISRVLSKDIKDTLKISYGALDDEEKQIFLDAACFFIGEKKSSAIAVWDGSGWSGLHSWGKLVNKCLVELDDRDYIRMHDHLRDLGREIANNHSPSRLWSPQQIDQIFKVDNRVQGISIRGLMATTYESRNKLEQFARCSQGGELKTRRGSCSLAVLCNPTCVLLGGKINTQRRSNNLPCSLLGLKIFHLQGKLNCQVLGNLLGQLVWLRLWSIEQRNLQSLNSLENLKVLELSETGGEKRRLRELWTTDDYAPVQLRELVIKGCVELQGFPKSMGHLRHLKMMIVDYNKKMRDLPTEFCLLESLEHLELTHCSRLSSLPNNFGNLRYLRHLNLSRCRELRKLPVSFKELRLLQHLELHDCSSLNLESDMMENMTKLEYLTLYNCFRLEELPRHITNQASLTELMLSGMQRLREIPANIDQLSKLQFMVINSDLLTSLPTSLGDLSCLTQLEILDCPKLECLPDSLGHLNLLRDLKLSGLAVKSLPKSVGQLSNLEILEIRQCPIGELDLGAGLLSCLKRIEVDGTEVSKISISQDCCPGLKTLNLLNNHNLEKIEVLPNTLESILLLDCRMLDALPSFAQSAFLREFKLVGCYALKKIQGLEHCRALEMLRADTRWEEEEGIESLEPMERMRQVELKATSRSSVEGCIQSMRDLQKWPKEAVIVCTRAVPDAATRVDDFDFSNLFVVDSFNNQKMKSVQLLKWPSTARCVLLCFVVNQEISQPSFCLHLGYKTEDGREYMGMEAGKWVWMAVLQRSAIYSYQRYTEEVGLCSYANPNPEEVEKGLLATGEEESLVEVFSRLWAFLSY